jgi:hypothetical protein
MTLPNRRKRPELSESTAQDRHAILAGIDESVFWGGVSTEVGAEHLGQRVARENHIHGCAGAKVGGAIVEAALTASTGPGRIDGWRRQRSDPANAGD